MRAMPRIVDALPPLYRELLPTFFSSEVPEETKATCSNCTMCDRTSVMAVDAVDGVSRFFRPDTKCCTYFPRLPNFLVGALLSDDRPGLAEGRRRVEERISGRIAVNPQWVTAPAAYSLMYQHSKNSFGRTAAMRCPYYEAKNGHCTIWAYREAVCSTFFCKYVAGADGRKFWMSLKTWLTLMEIQLSRAVLLELLPDYVLQQRDKAEASRSETLSAEEVDGGPPPERDYAAMWGAWKGREVEFYRAAYEHVRGLSEADVQRLLGLDGTVELAILAQRHRAATSPTLPERLQLNPETTVKWLPDGSVAMGSYSEYDAVALPGAAYALLVEFNGRDSVDGVRARLREKLQADLSEDVLLELYRHRILTEPGKGKAG